MGRKISKLIHSLQVKHQSPFTAKYFQPEEIFLTSCKTGGQKGTQRSILKPCQKRSGIVGSNLSPSITRRQGPFIDKGLLNSIHRFKFTYKITRQVHNMSTHVTVGTRTRGDYIMTPGQWKAG